MKKFGTFSLVFPLLEILNREKMNELIKEKLIEKGFVEKDGLLEIDLGDGERGVFNPETMTLDIHLNVADDVFLLVQEEVANDVQAEIQRALESGKILKQYEKNSGLQDLVEQQKGKMLAHATELKKQINDALKEVYKEAIKEKATQLGSVTNLSESSAGGVYKIRLEIEP